jgi:glycosyltransferase involved in cell wall biosynthesis
MNLPSSGQVDVKGGVVSTLWAPGDPAWSDVEVIDPRDRSWLGEVRAVLSAARRNQVVVLNGASRFHERYRDIAIAIGIARMRRPPAVVVAETAWDLGSAELRRGSDRRRLRLGGVVRAAVRALDGPHVTYCVFSRAERDLFVAAFGIDSSRVVVTPFGHTLWSKVDMATQHGDYVLAAGDALRDYPTLLDAVRGMDTRVRVVTRRELEAPPANVEPGPATPEEFYELLAMAGPVVVPIEPAPRSAGLITFLNAMALGKLVIVSDTTGVSDYVRDGDTGLLVAPRDPDALRARLLWALDPANGDEVRSIGQRARAEVLTQRPPTAYWRALRDVAARAAEVRRPARPANRTP